MDNNNYNWSEKSVFMEKPSGTVAKSFFASVFLWMFVALGVSLLAAVYMANTPEMYSYIVNPATHRMTTFGYVAMFGPVALVLLMGAGMRRLSYGAMVGTFLLYSLLTGVSLSSILLYYNLGSVIGCFASAAGIFGLMAVLGYTTETDLSRFGSILRIGVFGLVIAMFANFLLKSPGFDYITSFLGVAIFTGLAAYNVQNLKRIGAGLEENGETIANDDTKKLAIYGALTLYINFVNIFIFMLRIFGGGGRR